MDQLLSERPSHLTLAVLLEAVPLGVPQQVGVRGEDSDRFGVRHLVAVAGQDRACPFLLADLPRALLYT